MLMPSTVTPTMPLFQRIKDTGEVAYITEVHPTGRAVKLALHIESYRPEDLEPATEKEYLTYMGYRTEISVNYARMMRGQSFWSREEIDRRFPIHSPVGRIRLEEFRREYQ